MLRRERSGRELLTLEPDQAERLALNLIRHGQPFVIEQDPAVLKDVVLLARGASFQERHATHHYLRFRAVNLDEASQYAVNCFQHGLSFAVTSEVMPDQRREWVIQVERNKDTRLGSDRADAEMERLRRWGTNG